MEEQLRVALAPAGMEEDQPPKAEGVTRREFLQSSLMVPHAAGQAVTGTAPLANNPEQLLGYLLGVLAQTHESWPFALSDIPACHHVAVALRKYDQLTHGRRPPVLSEMLETLRAAVREQERQGGIRDSRQGRLWSIAMDAPEHFELAAVLDQISSAFGQESTAVDPVTMLNTFRQSGAPPLKTTAQRKEYLRAEVRQRIQQFVDDRLPEQNGWLRELQALPADGAPVSVDELTEQVFDGAERVLEGTPGRSLSLPEVLQQRFATLRDARWGEVYAAVQRRWEEAGVPTRVPAELLDPLLGHSQRFWESAPDAYETRMAFLGRLVSRLWDEGYFQTAQEVTAQLAQLSGDLGRPAAQWDWGSEAHDLLNDPQLQGIVRAPERLAPALQEADTLEALARGLLQRRREQEQVARRWPTMSSFQRWRDVTMGKFSAPPAIPASVITASAARLKPWQAWADERQRTLEVVPVSGLPVSMPSLTRGFQIYAPERWWEILRASLSVEDPLAVAFASPEAMVSGGPGIALLPMDEEPMDLADRPAVIRLPVTAEETPSPDTLAGLHVTLSLLRHLALQPGLRGRILLWTSESAQPLTWDQQQYLLLGAEA